MGFLGHNVSIVFDLYVNYLHNAYLRDYVIATKVSLSV